MNKEYKKILEIIKENPEISITDLAKQVGKSRQGLYYMLNSLIEDGVIVFKKSNFRVKKDLTSVK